VELEKFREMVESPNRSKDELLSIRANALSKDAFPHILLAEEVLEQRFPGWRKEPSSRGGSKPTVAMFEGERREFPSQKDAYLWLIERFIARNPKPFVELDWQTLLIAKGPRILYFAKSLRVLFRQRPDLAKDKNKYSRLSNGWYAQLVLNEEQKVEILERIASVSNLRMGVDWDWNGRGLAPDRIDADELFRELSAMSDRAPAADVQDAPRRR
jgi:hypothetical protein